MLAETICISGISVEEALLDIHKKIFSAFIMHRKEVDMI